MVFIPVPARGFRDQDVLEFYRMRTNRHSHLSVRFLIRSVMLGMAISVGSSRVFSLRSRFLVVSLLPFRVTRPVTNPEISKALVLVTRGCSLYEAWG